MQPDTVVRLQRLEPAEVSLEVVQALGLDARAVELGSPEALAASIRRAASFLCPTTPKMLVRAVADALAGLPGFASDEHVSDIESVVASLVSCGDLLELPKGDTGGRRLFLGPPSFIQHTSRCIILGVRNEGAPILGEELLSRVEYHRHLRLIRSNDSIPVHELLVPEGLIEIRQEHWLRAPRQSTAQDLIDDYVSRLSVARTAGDIEGIRIIDPGSDVRFYRGRWRALRRSDHGQFVARRPQMFGADLWCFAEVIDGIATRLLDLPIQWPLGSGSDEAWRLQAALDFVSDRPQPVRVRRTSNESGAMGLDLFSPVPSWSQRRLDFVATPTSVAAGALCSYMLDPNDVEEELCFLERMMWLRSDLIDIAGSHDK